MPAMNDRFDHTLEHTLKTKPDEGDEPVVDVRRIELVTGTGRRRQWSEDDKARIIVESLKPGANVSAIARRHGISPQQLFGWRREARALFCEDRDAEARGAPGSASPAHAPAVVSGNVPAFAPVVLVAPAARPPGSGGGPPSALPSKAGVIEIAVGATIVRVVGPVDADALATVLAVATRAAR
jgi:transposase